MSENTSTSENPPQPVSEPAQPVTVTPASPPAQTAVTSHSDDSGNSNSNSERMDRIEGAVAGLTETVGKLVDAITPNDHTPEKKPWTHWGSDPK